MIGTFLKRLLGIPYETKPGKYSELNANMILATVRRLEKRIKERFPLSGLSKVGSELTQVASETQSINQKLRKPIWLIRGGAIVAVIFLFYLVATIINVTVEQFSQTNVDGISDWLQAIEAGVNELIFLSIALFFLATIETRVKRQVSLRELHRLRSIAHVVDMHQLTKDPSFVLSNAYRALDTKESPARTMTSFELVRYLDYCTELLSLISKLAALYAQNQNDSVVVAAVNDLEDLAHGLSGKIWQKIMILDITTAQGSNDSSGTLLN